MNTPDPEDDLRRRFGELRDHDRKSAPRFERVLRARGEASQPRPQLGWWMRAAWGAAACVVLLAAWWSRSGHPESPPVAPAVSEAELAVQDEWQTPTDGLLADAGTDIPAPSIERLSREIAALLQP